jgi:hypothetical protein
MRYGASAEGAAEQVLGGFGRRRAALDFAFFKLNVPEEGFALLVDFIVRRARGVGQVRASVHGAAADGVHWLEQPLSACRFEGSGEGEEASIGPCRLGRARSAGTVGPVSWELAFRAAGPALVPLPAALERLRPTDLFLKSAPEVVFTGAVTVPGAAYVVREARGMLSTYHGRALPPRWSWVSCNVFDRPEVVLECTLARTRLFGAPFAQMDAGYFHLRAGGAAETIVAPFDGVVAVEGTRERFVLVARRRRGAREHRVTCWAPPAAYHDLGDGVHTTLVGSCEIHGLARAEGTAALEEREAASGDAPSP